MEEEITDVIQGLQQRYTPANFKKLGIKKGKVLTFDYEGSPVVLEITRITKDKRYFAKHVELHEPNKVGSHYGHNVDATQNPPFCTDCEVPVSEWANIEGKRKYEARKERHFSDGTPIDEDLLDDEE